MRKYFFVIFVFIIIVCITIPISYCFSDTYIWSTTFSEVSTNVFDDSSFTNSNEIVSISPENESIETSNNIDLNLESPSCILIEQNSGQILYEKNCHEKLRPASVTKVMPILLIMEALDSGKISLTDKVPCSENAAKMGGSQIWLDVREELSVDEMLKAICVVSANDCTVAMAEYLEGSEEAFVNKMNAKAKELGMNDTTFKNCHGIDEDGHVTSSYDIALMSRELLLKHPSITKYTTIYMDSLRDGKSELVNTNKLIRNYRGATGLKTGSTSLALYNLSASATRDGLSLIAVIMKAPTTKLRFAEAQKLLDFGFSNFSYEEFAKEGDVLKSIEVSKGAESIVNIIYANNAGALVKKGENKNIEQSVNIERNISAPVSKGQKLGEIKYSLNGNVVGVVDLVAENDVAKISFGSISKKVFLNWFRLLR